MRRARVLLLVGLLGAALPRASLAQARPKPPARAELPADVETAEALYGKLDYERANEVARRVLEQRGLTHDQLVRATRILAVTYAILDKDEQARDAFLRLLVSDPDYTVDPNLGPKVSTPFVEARGQYRALPSRPGVEVVPNVRDSGGQLRVTTRDPLHLAKKVTVGYRWSPSGEYTVTALPLGDATVEVAPAPAGRTRLDFYALALDGRDDVVFATGSREAPKSTFVEGGARPALAPTPASAPPAEERRGSVLSSPIFWIVTGAAVVGGGAAAFFALRPEAPTSASLSPQIVCGADLCK